MKLKNNSPIKKLSLSRILKSSERLPIVRQRRRFVFGQPIDDGSHYYHYKFLCFTCRKVWRPHIDYGEFGRVEECPECKGPVRMVRPMFKTPRSRDTRSWKQLERILGVKK